MTSIKIFKTLCAFVAFMLGTVTFCLIGCEVRGSLTTLGVLISFAVGLSLAIGLWIKLKNFQFKTPKLKPFDILMITVFALFCYRLFFWLCFPKDRAIYTLSATNYGDLVGHIGYIMNLLREKHFWPESPIIIGENFGYPFGTDLIVAMFLKLGAPLLNILPLMGFICGIFFLIALFFWGRGFALGAFLFSGGVAGYKVITTGVFKDYQSELAWKNLALALFVPQRGFLYAFPAGLLLLWSWRRRFLTKEEPLPFWFEGLIWGTMPLFHVHTFIFLSFIISVWTLWSRQIKESLKIFAVAFIPATFEMLLLTEYFHRSSLISFSPGWMIGDQNSFMFFWENYGLFFPLTIIALALVWRQKRNPERALITPAAVMYVICLLVAFSPWNWDNTKIMVWCYLLALPVLESVILDRLTPLAKMILIPLLFLSGFVSVYSIYQVSNGGFAIYQRDDVDGVCEAIRNIDHDLRFAVAQIHNHPVSMCGGRVVAGYGGTLWSQGSKSQLTEAKLTRLMRGDPQWKELAKELHARYIFWGPAEATTYQPSARPWEASQVKIAEGSWGTIYDLGE